MDNNQWKIFEDSRQSHFMQISNFHKLSNFHYFSIEVLQDSFHRQELLHHMILFDAQLINSIRQKTAVLQFFSVFFS